MRRSIFMLAAGLLAAGTVVTTAGAASAGATAVHRAGCTVDGSAFINVTSRGVNYFVGTPNSTFSGATVRLKPMTNVTTQWTACFFPGGTELLLNNRGLVMTSRSLSPGADVTVERAGNGGNGFASQQWTITGVGTNTATFQNVKTGLFLRVRNSGPIMGQTVTTGNSATDWILS